MNRLPYILILLVLLSISCKEKENKESIPATVIEKTAKVEKKEVQSNITLKLECSNEYALTFQYLDEGKAKLEITTNGKTRTLNMNHVQSGSGEKYASEDNKTIFWMAKGEATLTENGKDLCTCTIDQ